MTYSMPTNVGKIKSVSLPWFRFYTEALDDPKVQRLPPHLFKTWVNLLCIAGQNAGKLPSIDDIAFKLRLSAQDAENQLSELVLAGLIDITSEGRSPHNWSQRQFQSDSSTERVRKYRKNKAETPCNVSETVTVTPPEQNRTEQIQSREDKNPAPPDPKPSSLTPPTRGSRLPVAWQLPENWRMWARTTFPQSSDVTVAEQAAIFADYWQGLAGQKARKADWEATWRNWCRRAFATAPIRPMSQPPPSVSRAAAIRALLNVGSPS